MRTGSQLGLLLAAVILGNFPSARSPGERQPSDHSTAICPTPGCERKIAKKVAGRFYCQHCKRYFTAEEAAKPGPD